jgi:hypothetical protein
LSDIHDKTVLKESVVPLLMGDVASIRRGQIEVTFAGVVDSLRRGFNNWFKLMSRDIFSSEMFENMGSCTRISSKPDNQIGDAMRMVGRFMAIGLIKGTSMDVNISESFYALLLGSDVTLDMIENCEPEMFEELKWLQFATPEELLAYNKPIPGFDNNIKIDEINRESIIRTALNYIAINGQFEKFEFLLKGFCDILPQKVIEGFEPKDMQDFNSYNKLGREIIQAITISHNDAA